MRNEVDKTQIRIVYTPGSIYPWDVQGFTKGRLFGGSWERLDSFLHESEAKAFKEKIESMTCPVFAR